MITKRKSITQKIKEIRKFILIKILFDRVVFTEKKSIIKDLGYTKVLIL